MDFVTRFGRICIKSSHKVTKSGHSILQEEFQHDPKFLSKLKNLKPDFPKFRRVRPDGNCFFRSVAFSIMENLLDKPEAVKVERDQI